VRWGLLAVGVLVAASLPWPGLLPAVAAENPSAANVYAGDAHAANSGTGVRHHALRLVSDANVPQHRAGWEVGPGAGYTLFYREWATGVGVPGGPDGDADDVCRLEIYDGNSGTVVRTLRSATTCPANTTSYTVFCTSDGTSSGSPRAGTFRLRVIVTAKTGGIAVYDVDSDTQDKGAIRCGTTISSIAHDAYPAGSTYAYTVAGESAAWTVTLTAASTNQVRKYNAVVLDNAGSIPSGFTSTSITQTAGATTFATSKAVSDSWPASAASYGLRVTITDTSPLTGVKWTHIHSVTAPVIMDSSAQVNRPSFYDVDPRITATHLLQVNSASFASPPMATDIGMTRFNDDIGYYATRYTNARGEGLSGASFAFTSTLQDNGLVLAADTGTGLTIGTQGGQAGWSTLRTWNNGAPLGGYTKTVDVTAPSTIDNDAHLLSTTAAYTLSLPDVEATYTGADPLTVYALYNASSGLVHIAIHSRLLNGDARLDVEDEVFFDAYNADHDLVADDQAVLEQSDGDGAYIATWDPPGNGLYEVVAHTTNPEGGNPVGAHTLVLVQNSTIADLENATMNVDLSSSYFQDTLAPLIIFLVAFFYAWYRCHVTGAKWLFAIVVLALGVLSLAVPGAEPYSLGIAVVTVIALALLMLIVNRFGIKEAGAQGKDGI
jgi:hypothetical protein